MTSPRWWDGCERPVTGIERFRAEGQSRAILVLSCGHKQVAPARTVVGLDAAICRECARNKGGES